MEVLRSDIDKISGSHLVLAKLKVDEDYILYVINNDITIFLEGTLNSILNKITHSLPLSLQQRCSSLIRGGFPHGSRC
jgi:hypothetical protein